MLKIGITGGIGTGKSTVCRIFKLLDVPVYDADSRAKWLMINDPELKSKIQEEFGQEAYFNDGKLNRQYLAKEVFSNNAKIEKLNALVHPAVGKDFEIFCEQHNDEKYVLKEAALMYESGSDIQLDKVIVVTAPLQTRIERVLARDPQRSKEQIMQIIEKQMPEKEKLKRADYIIENAGTDFLIKQVIQLHQEFSK